MVEYIGKETEKMFIRPINKVIRLLAVIFFLCFSSVFLKNFTKEYKITLFFRKKSF